MRRTTWALIVLVLQLTGCSHATSPPIQPPPQPPAPQIKFFAVHIRDVEDEKGLVGAIGRIDQFEVVADDNGRLVFDRVPWDWQAIRLVITADGYETFNDTVMVSLQPTTDLEPIRVKRIRHARPGVVRLENRALADDAGLFNPVGVTMFWALWGYQHDLARLDQNLGWLADHGVDFIRVLGTAGPGGGWEDRSMQLGPTWETDVAGLIDRAYDKFGIRIELTIFGGAESTESPAARSGAVESVIRLLAGREHKVILVEVSNEGQAFGGSAAGIAEMRSLGRRLNQATPVLIALTSATHAGTPCELYGGAGMDVATIHYERGFASDPPGWRPVRQPWGWPGEYETECGGLSTAWNNEPIGPKSSVVADDDPRRLVMAYVTTFIAGNSAYVLHSGPGIRGGGAGDQPRGREANFWEAPSVDIALRAIQKLKAVLPPGLANYGKQNDYWAGFPFDDGFRRNIEQGILMRAYAATSGGRFAMAVLGARPNATVGAGAKQPYQVDVCEAVSGACQPQTLNAGQVLSLTGAEGYLVVGQVR